MAKNSRASRPKKVEDAGSGSIEPPAADARLGYTTFRIYADDGENLVELAGKRGKTIAQLYRELFGKAVRDLLIEETRKRLKALEGSGG